MISERVKDLVLQSLAHEQGGVQVYRTALRCAQNEDLREEWTKYLEQTEEHVEILTEVCEKLKLDPMEQTAGCQIVEFLGQSLVRAMEMALAGNDPAAAQIVACECVVLAETKDHLDWELMEELADGLKGNVQSALRPAVDQIEDQEDEHLYHTKGWCRELWLDALGMPAALPPPEEERDVKTAIGAARAEQHRKEYIKT